MTHWLDVLRAVEPLEDLEPDPELVRAMQACNGAAGAAIHFHTPSFKSFRTSELNACGRNVWPAVSITGADCKLQCDHCKARILEPMMPARTPEALWRLVNERVAEGAKGMLLTGGSNHRNEVEYGPYFDTIRRIKDAFPGFRIALHTALVDADTALSMEQAGIDAAMMDVIGAQDTITQVYHLKRRVDDFEATLAHLVATRMRVVPHIVIGLHYGRLLGEWAALDMLKRHCPDALVLVVVMPFYATQKRPFAMPDAHEVGRFFMDARAALPTLPLLLGCARPSGDVKARIDAYAVMAGLNGIAHPAEGIVELAARLGRRVHVTPTCCSIGLGDEAMALDDDPSAIEIDLDAVLLEERRRRAAASPAFGIPVVSANGACGS